jgi:hypothetical protein
MHKEALATAVSDVRASWEATLAELGPKGLERPGATGEWRVRDVLAHFNGWDRWQLVQLRCAFTGETPTDHELQGGIEFPPNDDMSEDAMNAMFQAGNRDRALDDVVADWREVSGMRASWVAAASQDQLDTVIGADWAGGTQRIFRLASEVPSVSHPERVWQRILDQVEHQEQHLQFVQEWMRG